ncbi:MAG: helix-turn-helix transcriptional regulator [Bacteroidales bacterium]|nr:helix-turn-helix transcriptional regulator [Bacteroidales bacterium]
MKENENIVGEQIKLWRNKKGFTQETLARRSNIPLSTIQKVENSIVKNPSLNTIMAIAAGLDITLDELMEMK